MKRHILIIAATAATLLTSFAADAQDRGRGRGRGEDRRAERQYDRGGGYERGGGYDRPGNNGRGLGRGNGRIDRGPRYDARPDYRRDDPRDRPPPYYADRPGQSWRQGQRLPPMYRGDVLRDPGRFRLRAAPPGYDWVGVGPDIYLVQRSTGMVLDSIPGGF